MRTRRVLLLGCGAQGRAALHDLACGADPASVVVADHDARVLDLAHQYPADRVTFMAVDAADETRIASLMRDADVVVEALPGSLALPTARLAAACGVSLVSSMYLRDPQERDSSRIASTARQVREIDEAAREKGIVILPEFGLDPGLDLILGVRALSELDEVREFHSYGAGIPGPAARGNALGYRFSWSPLGVMRSYARPATIITGGEAVVINPEQLFEPGRYHVVDVPDIGASPECFPNGDAGHYAELFGVRATVREMARYTGRLSGHCAFWNVMAKIGFLGNEPIALGGGAVAPIEFTAALLAGQEQFSYGSTDEDLAWIRVDVRGARAGRDVRIVHDLVDRRDFASGFTAMQRTVGFTLALGARLILDGSLGRTGLVTPLDVPYDLVFPALERRGIRVRRRESPWASSSAV